MEIVFLYSPQSVASEMKRKCFAIVDSSWDVAQWQIFAVD